MVERVLAKDKTAVRFRSPAPNFKGPVYEEETAAAASDFAK